jgi:tetratricopeptide (TPR) repeat protein
VECHRQALVSFTELGNEYGAADARSSLAWVHLYLGDPKAALQDLGMALDTYRRSGRTRNEVIILRGIALATAALNRFQDALAGARQAKARSLAPLDHLMSANCIAWIHFRAGHHDEAEHRYAEAIALGKEEGSSYGVARATTGLANIAALRGDHTSALRLWAKASELSGQLNLILLGEARVRTELERAMAP